MISKQLTAALLFALVWLSNTAIGVHGELVVPQRASHAANSSGGLLTVITGADKGLVLIRSARFF